MNSLKVLQYTYWQNGDSFVGFLNVYPDNSTWGNSLVELEKALVKIYEARQEENRRLAKIRKAGIIRIPA